MTTLVVLMAYLVVLIICFALGRYLATPTVPFLLQRSTLEEKLVNTSSQKMTNPCAEILKEITYVGGYRLGGSTGLLIMFKEKPIFIKRFLMKHLLGWEWEDEPRQRNQAR